MDLKLAEIAHNIVRRWRYDHLVLGDPKGTINLTGFALDEALQELEGDILDALEDQKRSL
jgi:hypothetical protein